MAETDEQLHPARAIRRFDVFAEYTRQERREKGDPADAAQGYGIWLAKVVAARRFGASAKAHQRPPRDDGGPAPAAKFRSLGDEPQTDDVFDREIVERMGPAFYRGVFRPAIEAARAKGEAYEQVRDAIRTGWKPER